MSTSTTNQQNPEILSQDNPALWQVQSFIDEHVHEDNTTLNPLALIERIFRDKMKKSIMMMLALGLLFFILVFLAIDPLYDSRGLVRVVAREPKILTMDRDDSRLRLYDAFVTSELTYIQSQVVMRRAYELYQERMKERENIVNIRSVGSFADRFTISKKKGLIVLSASSTSAELSHLSSNALLDAYAQLHMEQSDTRQNLRVRELDIRQTDLMNKLKQLNIELLSVGEEFDFLSLSKAHLAKVTQLEEISSRLDELSNSLAEMEAKGGTLDADTGDMEIKRATLLDRAMADMVFERAKLAAELNKRRLRYQETHPKILNLTASITVIDKAIETRRQLIATLGKTGAITGGDGANKEQSMAELFALKKKLQLRKDEISKDAKKLNGKMIELKRINEEKSVITGMLAETRRVLDQVRLESRNNMPGTVEVLSRGSFPEKPTKDKRFPFAIVGFLFGSGLGALIVIALHFLSKRYEFSDDIEKELNQNIPVLAFGLQEHEKKQKLKSLLSRLELSDRWNINRSNIVSISRYDPNIGDISMDIALNANECGIKTLIIQLNDNQAYEDVKGFMFGLDRNQKVNPIKIKDVDFIPYGRLEKFKGYSINKAMEWIDLYTEDYDMILLTSSARADDTSRDIVSNLSSMNIACILQGQSKQSVTLAHTQPIFPVMFHALPSDPALAVNKKSPLELLIGGLHGKKEIAHN
ncbi:hypothetical protein QGN29_02660 [Temperatibacter marinus]|uniref:Uncharacterized protein n=1 Tax=Temperatibacter marinus TaxID=1456591 RepID=A0AA52EJ72_9PROT|nr:hypothetical protein [Temperatibacter marinus]WND03269.1 hypothetical protein QGN29_02660 [Temperatibacter marinus]